MTAWLDLLMEPMSFAFMQRALLTAIATSIVCAIFSCFLVLKGWSLMGDAISHAVLPGVVLAFLAGIPLVIGAFVSGLFCAVATGYIKEHCRVKEDSVMGIVFSGMFAAGLVLFSRVNTEQHLSHILFGNVLGVTDGEMLQTVVIAVVVTLAILIKFKDLMLFCFDPIQAKVIGLPVRFYHYALLCLLALTIVAALQAVGVVLVVAMLITPGITAFLLCKTLPKMLLVAVTTSLIAAIAGTFISFYIDAATGPAIVLVQAALFLLALAGRLLTRTQRAELKISPESEVICHTYQRVITSGVFMQIIKSGHDDVQEILQILNESKGDNLTAEQRAKEGFTQGNMDEAMLKTFHR